MGKDIRVKGVHCPLCAVHLDTQAHSLLCEEVKEKISVKARYSDIFREKIYSLFHTQIFHILFLHLEQLGENLPFFSKTLKI